MTQVTDRRELRHQRTRQEILEAAWELAERDGIAALSLRDLGAQVGMQAPSLYNYFDGKDDLYDAMFAQGYEQLMEHEATIAAEVDGLPREVALVRSLEGWMDFCQRSIPRYQLMFTQVIPGWEPSAEAYEVSQRAYAQATRELATLGIEGERNLDLFTGLSSGLVAQQIANDPQGGRWRRLIPDAVAMFLNHLDEEAAR